MGVAEGACNQHTISNILHSWMKPRFSIVFPTRNRAEWLAECVEAALAQDFPSFEVVVVDNSSPGPSATEDVVRAIASEKLRYVRTGGLGMPENWQVAVNSVKGEYFILCSDKLLLARGLLTVLDQAISNLGCEICVWKIGTETQVAKPLSSDGFTPTLVRGRDIWECAGAGLWTLLNRAAARGMNSCLKTSIVPAVESKLGVNFCRPTNPDYVIGLSLSALGYDSWFFDMIGTGFIENADGNGMLCLTAPDEEFVKNHFHFPELSDLPLPFAIGTNLIYQDIVAINRILPQADRTSINWENYFLQIIHTAVNADELGGFGEKRKAILLRVLSERTLREKASLLKTIVEQESINLLKGKFPFTFQIRRMAKLVGYAIFPLMR